MARQDGDGATMRVVIGEDQFLLRDGLVRLLEAHGFEIAAAVDSGPALLEALLGERPDVAVVDIRLPLKDRVFDGELFVGAVRQVAGGGTVMDSEVVTRLLTHNTRDTRLESLTAREREVLGLMAQGRSNSSIAGTLVVSEKAVSKHINNMLAKLQLPQSGDDNRRVLAVLTYLKRER